MAGRSVTGVIVFLSAALLLAGAVSARADPFYLRYDADEVYPEDAGWERHTTDPYGLLERSLADGILTIDSRRSAYITDWYDREIAELELAPGEELRFTWRVNILEADTDDGDSDTNVAVSNASAQYVKLFLAPTFVAANEDGVSGPEHIYELAQQGWHTFLLSSFDMLHYDLFVDNTYAFSGDFTRHLIPGPNRVSFGDTFIGLTSRSAWDFVEIQVVPEPPTA
ncbi:MAG: hypothetical protein PVJ57_15435 [Phycisphaerae bacterium]